MLEKTHKKAVERSTYLSILYMDSRDKSSTLYRNTQIAQDERDFFAQESQAQYENLFGGSDYRSVPDARSVLSPAAYLTSLKELADRFIDTGAVRAGYGLSDRRPDINEVPRMKTAPMEG